MVIEDGLSKLITNLIGMTSNLHEQVEHIYIQIVMEQMPNLKI